MKKINFLMHILPGVIMLMSIFSCKSLTDNGKSTEESSNNVNQSLFTRKPESIDRPDWDSSISIKDAQIMIANYNKDSRKFKFMYHDPTDSNRLKEGIMQGFLFNTDTIQNMISSSGCKKIYVAFGIHPRVLASGDTEMLLTTILLPVNKGNTPGSYSIVTNKISGGDQTGVEFSTPCPPYCLK